MEPRIPVPWMNEYFFPRMITEKGQRLTERKEKNWVTKVGF